MAARNIKVEFDTGDFFIVSGKAGKRTERGHRTSHRTSLEFLLGAAQVLRNYGIDWS